MITRRNKVLKKEWALVDNLPIHINVTSESGCHERMLRMFKKQLDIMLQHHRKVFAVPLTVNYRTHRVAEECEDLSKYKNILESGKNTLMSLFMRDVRAYMKTNYGKEHMRERKTKTISRNKRPIKIQRLGFFWTREFSKEGDYPHYHLWLLIDGSQLKSGFKLAQRLMPLAKKYNLALCYMKNSARTVDRNDVSAYWSLLYHFSYSAKEASKDKTRKSKNANEHGSSKLKPPLMSRWNKFTLESVEAYIRQGNTFSIYRQRDYLNYRSYSALLDSTSGL